jgi:hypothetical protein
MSTDPLAAALVAVSSPDRRRPPLTVDVATRYDNEFIASVLATLMWTVLRSSPMRLSRSSTATNRAERSVVWWALMSASFTNLVHEERFGSELERSGNLSR